MLQQLKNRRTIRQFSEKKIDEQVLKTLFECAFRSSTTGNMQLYSVVKTEDQANKEALAKFHFNQPVATAAPTILTFCADFNRFKLWCEQSKAKPGYDNFLSFMTAAIDAIIATQTFCVAAEAQGLGICYLGTVTYMAEGIIDFLKLPQGVVPVTALAVGYPDEQQHHPQVDRLPVETFLHNEHYHHYTDTDIKNAYAAKEALEENQQFVKENDKETLAQVFTDIRYKQADNEHFSEALLSVLKKQGFL